MINLHSRCIRWCLLGLVSLGFSLTGWTAEGQRHPAEDERLTVKLTFRSTEKPTTKTFALDSKAIESRLATPSLAASMVRKLLKAEDFQELAPAKAYYHIQVKLSTAAPQSSLDMKIGSGSRNMFRESTHEVTLTASHQNEVMWSIQASTKTDYERVADVLHLLLAATRPFLGKTAENPITVTIPFNAPSAAELKGK